MSLAALLKEHTFLELTPKNRIKCNILGHEMPPTFHAVNTYIGSKKLKKAKELYSFDYSVYEPYIIPNKKDNKMLYCNVTNVSINKHPDKVKLHMKGYKFLSKKPEYDAELKAKEKMKKKDVKKSDKTKQKRSKVEAATSNSESEEESEEDETPDFWVPPEELEEETSEVEEEAPEMEEEVEDVSPADSENEDEDNEISIGDKLMQKLVSAQPSKAYKRKLEHHKDEDAVSSKTKKKTKKVEFSPVNSVRIIPIVSDTKSNKGKAKKIKK